jgi:hypothetical protein
MLINGVSLRSYLDSLYSHRIGCSHCAGGASRRARLTVGAAGVRTPGCHR